MALTREDIVAAALDIVDEYGLADLSMRRLAGTLGVQPGALYHHVPNKQALLAALADEILAQVTMPQSAGIAGLGEWATALRATLVGHRDSAEVVATARGFGLLATDALQHPATLLPLNPDQAMAATRVVWHYVVGYVAEEHARQDWERFAGPAPAVAGSFDDGLAIVLAGIGD